MTPGKPSASAVWRAATAGFDSRMRTSLAAVAAVGGAFTLGALVLGGMLVGLSVGIGAALAVGNLWVLGRVVVALLPGGSPSGTAEDEPRDERGQASGQANGWVVVGALKMVGLMAIVWLLMKHGVVSPLLLVVGFAALPVGIAIGAVVSDRATRS